MGITRIEHAYCTLTEAAAAIGVSQARARQIEKAALKKCRQYMERRGITPADLDDASQLQQIDTSSAEQSFDAAAEQEAMTCCRLEIEGAQTAMGIV